MKLLIGFIIILVGICAKATDNEDYEDYDYLSSNPRQFNNPGIGRIYTYPLVSKKKRETTKSKTHAAAFQKGYARNACYCMKKEICPEADVQDCKADFKCCTMDEIVSGRNLN